MRIVASFITRWGGSQLITKITFYFSLKTSSKHRVGAYNQRRSDRLGDSSNKSVYFWVISDNISCQSWQTTVQKLVTRWSGLMKMNVICLSKSTTRLSPTTRMMSTSFSVSAWEDKGQLYIRTKSLPACVMIYCGGITRQQHLLTRDITPFWFYLHYVENLSLSGSPISQIQYKTARS